MALEYTGIDVSFTAAEDLSSHQYRFVHMATDTTVDLLDDGTTEFPIGILQNDPASGETAVVRITGVSKCVFNYPCAVGRLLKAEYVGATDNGKSDLVDTDYDIVRAVCLIAAGAEDDVGTVLLCVDVAMVSATATTTVLTTTGA